MFESVLGFGMEILNFVGYATAMVAATCTDGNWGKWRANIHKVVNQIRAVGASIRICRLGNRTPQQLRLKIDVARDNIIWKSCDLVEN
uniref:Uncharacterized protein n=1 Tax=Romanomermis culicivorax TaxID=13658 RepID=A0A915JE54_ROMCU